MHESAKNSDNVMPIVRSKSLLSAAVSGRFNRRYGEFVATWLGTFDRCFDWLACLAVNKYVPAGRRNDRHQSFDFWGSIAISFTLLFFLQLVMHYPIEHIGLLMAITPIIGGLVSPLAGNLSDRFGTRSIMLIGLILMTIGSLAVSTIAAKIHDVDYILRIIPL